MTKIELEQGFIPIVSGAVSLEITVRLRKLRPFGGEPIAGSMLMVDDDESKIAIFASEAEALNVARDLAGDGFESHVIPTSRVAVGPVRRFVVI